jgi:ribosomal protein S18 acetylase RimI-like enzyme
MQKRLASDEYRFHVAEDGSVLAGVVAMLGSSHLYYLFVASAYQRMGLARLLWDLARNESVRAGNASGRFTVKASPYAVRAYERLGFRRSGPMTDVKGVRSQPMDWAGTT